MIGGIEYPTQIASGRNGEIAVASYMSHKVHIYDRDRQLIRTFGSTGYLDGQFVCPSGIAIDRHNRVFVSSTTKVDVFTIDGDFITATGSHGKGPLQFSNATGIAVSKEGKIYVADSQNNRIQVLNSDLTFCTSFSEASKTVGSGCLSQPQAIAINSEGNLFVADMMNHAVQVFAPDGTFLLKFGKYGPATTPGAICTPTAIAVDRQDNVYVGNSTGTIGIFSKEGNFLRQFGSYGSELGQFSQIKGLHVDRKGRLHVSEWVSNRIQIFPASPSMVGEENDEDSSPTEQYEAENVVNSVNSVGPTSMPSSILSDIKERCKITESGNSPTKPFNLVGPASSVPIKVISGITQPNGIMEGKNGELIVSSLTKNKLLVYSTKKDYQLMNELDDILCPFGIGSTSNNLIVVSCSRKLQWFTMDGNFVHLSKEKFSNPNDVAIGKDGRIYVIDSGFVKILNGDDTLHHSFKLSYLDDDENNRPPDSLALNSEGNLYITDKSCNCVRVYTPGGDALFKFGKSGSYPERGVLVSPMAIAIDGEDNVYVGNVMMISIFDKSGSFLRSFGGYGDDLGQFSLIRGLHIGRNGHLYVSDFCNNRVQVFEGLIPRLSDDQMVVSGQIISIPEPVNFSKTPDSGGENVVTPVPIKKIVGPNFAEPVKTISDVVEPTGVTGAGGDFVVASRKVKKLVIFNHSDFEYQGEISRLTYDPARNSEMVDLTDVALSQDGNFLISVKHRVLKISPNGEVITTFGSPGKRGSGDSQLDTPCGIAVGKTGQVFVVDSGNCRIQVFRADLTLERSLQLPDNEGLEKPALERVAVNSEGSIYVTDKKNKCIHVFDEKFLFSFKNLSVERDVKSSFFKHFFLPSPEAITIDHENNIYVATSNDEILLFAPGGHLLRVCGKRGDEPGQFRGIKAMHFDQKGNLYVCESKSDRIQIFVGTGPTSEGGSNQAVNLNQEEPETVLDNIREPRGIAEGKNGEIVIASSSDHKISVYDHEHQLKVQFGTRGDVDGQINCPTGVAVTADNLILVSCRDKLQWFTMEGQLVNVIGGKGKEVSEFDNPVCTVIGRDEKIYVLEKGNKRVQIFKGNASYSSSFKIDKDKFHAEALAINSEGKIFVVDTSNSFILVFSPEGNYLSNFSVKDSKEPSFPTTIAIDRRDNVYIGNANGVISMFDKNGSFVRAFQGGDHHGRYTVIRGLCVSERGCMYISDYSNNRVKVFELPDSINVQETDSKSAISLPVLRCKPMHTIGPKSLLPIKVFEGILKPSGIATDKDGNVFISSNQENKILICNPGSFEASSQITEIRNPRDPKFKGIVKPSGLAYTSDGYLLVSFQNQVVKMGLNGTAVLFLGNVKYRKGSKEDELSDPGGIASGNDGKIFLVDRGNHRVQTLQNDFTYTSSLQNPDSSKSRYEYLERVALNSGGDLFITDCRNCNVQVYNNSGRFVFDFGIATSKGKYKRGGLCHPHAIAIDKEDFIYVGDENGVVSIFDKTGSFVRSFGGPGEQPGRFGDIQAMHFDNEGKLYVCEWKTNRVQVFQ